MTNEEILKKSIEKAVKNGFICIENTPPIHISKLINNNLYYSVIFNHDFAKAFFKNEEWNFIYYLKEMVLTKEPLKYLEKFLDK